MIRGLVSMLELHHKVRILDEAVSEAVRLSARYIPARQLPDKAVSLLDTACARVAMSQNAIPAPIDDRQRRIGLIDTELKIVEREMSAGADHATRRDELTAERQRIERRAGQPAEALGGRARHRDRDRRGARQHRCRTGAPRPARATARQRRRKQRRPSRSRQAGGALDAPARAAGRTAAHLSRGRRPGDRRDRRGLDRHSGPPDAVRRDPHRAQPARSRWSAASSAKATPWKPSRRPSAPAGPA